MLHSARHLGLRLGHLRCAVLTCFLVSRPLFKSDNIRQSMETQRLAVARGWGWEEMGVIAHGGEASFRVMDMFWNYTVVMVT